MAGDNVRMKIDSLCKVYPGVMACKNVSFEIRAGEVHVLIGENGAGKSTLVKMLAGLERIDGGTVTLDGEPYNPKNVLDAQAHGVNMIHQELSLMDDRTVAQNIFIGREPMVGKLFVDNKKMNQKCKELFASLDLNISPTELVRNLSIAQQQMVEVAKALSHKSKVLILDEPTSSLTIKEIDALFAIIRKLKADGVSLIYISHRMQELLDIGDRVTVMRDGQYIGTRDTSNLDMSELITMMVGRTIENVYPRTYNKIGEEVLRTEDLCGLRFRNVNLTVHAGEIVGIAGLVGAGRSELVKSIFGFDPITSGSVYLRGQKLNPKKNSHSTVKAVRNNMSLLPEDRKKEGLFLDMSIKENLAQAVMPKVFKNGLINKKFINENSKKYVAELAIATPSDDKLVGELSGGNQQKVVVGKWLSTDSNFLIFDEPTRGIDVGAKTEIYTIMNNLAANGAGVLVVSSDLPELIGVADRVYVMKDGEVTGVVGHEEEAFTQEGLLTLAFQEGAAV